VGCVADVGAVERCLSFELRPRASAVATLCWTRRRPARAAELVVAAWAPPPGRRPTSVAVVTRAMIRLAAGGC